MNLQQPFSSVWRKLVLLLFVTTVGSACQCQYSSPLNSGFKRDRQIEAKVTDITTSECRGAVYVKGGEIHYDDTSYDVEVSGNLTFTNRSNKTVMLFKDPNPTLTERIAESQHDLALGNSVGGFDSELAFDGQPEPVSLDDFATLRPGESFLLPIKTIVAASTRSKRGIPGRGKYFLQLGIDARPEAFCDNGTAEREFKRKWKIKKRFVHFVLSAPFELELKLDPNAEPCKE